MILTHEKAHAVYLAMLQLNTIGAIINVRVSIDARSYAVVYEEIMGDDVVVALYECRYVDKVERFAGQMSFAKAYGVEV